MKDLYLKGWLIFSSLQNSLFLLYSHWEKFNPFLYISELKSIIQQYYSPLPTTNQLASSSTHHYPAPPTTDQYETHYYPPEVLTPVVKLLPSTITQLHSFRTHWYPQLPITSSTYYKPWQSNHHSLLTNYHLLLLFTTWFVFTTHHYYPFWLIIITPHKFTTTHFHQLYTY